VNLTSAGTWRAPVEELISVGPIQVSVKLPQEVRGRAARLLVADRRTSASVREGWSRFEIKSILDHEVVVLA